MRVLPRELGVENLPRVFSEHHVGVFGATGKGKTVFLRWLMARMPGMVTFFNPDEERLPAERVHSLHEYARVLEKGKARRVDYVPHVDPDIATRELGALQAYQFSLGNRMRRTRDPAPHWMLDVVDEAHEFAPKTERQGPLHRLMKRGRKRGIHVTVASQRPAEIAHVVLTQADYHIYFELNDYESSYFKTYGIPLEEFRSWIERPFHFAVVRGNKWTPFKPVRP